MPRTHRLAIAILALIFQVTSINSLAAQVTATSIVTSMKNELKNLVTAQEAHFADWATYAPALGPRSEKGVAYFNIPSGTTIVLSHVNQYGWTGVMTNTTLGSPITCGVYVGEAKNSPNAAVKQEAAPACWGEVAISAQPPAPVSGSAESIVKSMKMDLRNLVVSQEAYFTDFNTYAAKTIVQPYTREGAATFVPSGNNRVKLSNVTPSGWTAVITNAAVATTCGIFIGPPRNAPNAAVIEEGAPACW